MAFLQKLVETASYVRAIACGLALAAGMSCTSSPPSPRLELPSQRYGITDERVVPVVDNLVELVTEHDGRGNGVFLSPTTILTAYHVLNITYTNDPSEPQAEPTQGKLTLLFRDRVFTIPPEEYSLRLPSSPYADLAEVHLSSPVDVSGGISELHLPQHGSYNKGDAIQMVGYRRGEFTNTFGHLTSPERLPDEPCKFKFNTDMNVRRGNSGSPILAGADRNIIGILSQANFRNGAPFISLDSYLENGDAIISLVMNLDPSIHCTAEEILLK